MIKIILYVIGSLGAIVVTIIAYGGDAQKARPDVRSLDMPKTVISNFSKDSELVVFGVSDRVVRKPVLINEKAIIEVIDPESYLLEIESRDEESWTVSVLNAWKVTHVTKPILESFDLRDYMKVELTIMGMPREASFASFFKVDGSGVRDWVCVHQAILDGNINDNLFSPGSWVCVPLDGAGKQISTPRIVHITKLKVSYVFENLPKIDEFLGHALNGIRRYTPKNDFSADPFSNQELKGKDPFE